MNVVEVERVAKRYRADAGSGPRRLRTLLEGAGRDRKSRWALKDVSLGVARGEGVGLIGGNGSGKSTLLRVVAGLSRPTRGRVRVQGEVSGLLTLGGAMEPLMSGEENAVTGAILAGLTRREAIARLDEVAAFAELEDALDQPLRTYSDGMRLRLAFAMAVHIDPEVLLVDEILAVGDLRFQQKCMARLDALREQGVTVLLASHDTAQVQRLCSRTVWLADGQVRLLGETEEVLERYRSQMLEDGPPPVFDGVGGMRAGTREVEIKAVRLLGAGGRPVSELPPGVGATVELDFVAHEPIPDAMVSVGAHAAGTGAIVLQLTTTGDGWTLGGLPTSGTVRLRLDRLDLARGTYHLDVGIYEAETGRPYDFIWQALSFDVPTGPVQTAGHLAPPRGWEALVTAVLPALDGGFPLTDETVASFRRDGHCVVRGLASADEVAAYRPVIEDAALRFRRETRPLEERDAYGQAFLQVPNLWARDDAVRPFTTSPRFAAVAAALLGEPGVRLYHDQALFKEGGGGRTPFHQDQHYWPLDGDQTITMWMPLVPVPEEIGSMTFASGSHHLGYLGELPISDESEEVFRRLIDDRGLTLDTHGALTPGDATFHAGWTLHGAPPNPTGTLRAVMTVIYFADGLRATEPDHPYRAFDLKTWLKGVEPGELAAGPLNPRLWPPSPPSPTA